MLQQVLQALEEAEGPVSLDALSRQLGIERGALDGMIAFWVRKGRLRDSSLECGSAGGPGCSCASASQGGGCPFDRTPARTITLVPPRHSTAG